MPICYWKAWYKHSIRFHLKTSWCRHHRYRRPRRHHRYLHPHWLNDNVSNLRQHWMFECVRIIHTNGPGITQIQIDNETVSYCQIRKPFIMYSWYWNTYFKDKGITGLLSIETTQIWIHCIKSLVIQWLIHRDTRPTAVGRVICHNIKEKCNKDIILQKKKKKRNNTNIK